MKFIPIVSHQVATVTISNAKFPLASQSMLFPRTQLTSPVVGLKSNNQIIDAQADETAIGKANMVRVILVFLLESVASKPKNTPVIICAGTIITANLIVKKRLFQNAPAENKFTKFFNPQNNTTLPIEFTTETLILIVRTNG